LLRFTRNDKKKVFLSVGNDKGIYGYGLTKQENHGTLARF